MKVRYFCCSAIGAVMCFLHSPALLSQRVELVWSPSPSSGISHYNVYRSDKTNLPFSLTGSVPHPDTTFIDEIDTENICQFYAVTSVDSAGNESDFSNVVKAEISDGNNDFCLGANYPNPFNPTTIIEYSLQNAGHAVLVVYNTRGQVVKRLLDANQSAGIHRVTWDGTNDQGVRLSSGVYYYRLETPYGSLVRRMIMLR